ncbi:endonuclease MutS2, partial [Streptococcus suis]
KEIVYMALAESEDFLKNLHAAASIKPHQIIEAKAELIKLAPEVVDLSKIKVLKKAKIKREAMVGDDIIVTAYGQRGTL